MAAKRQLKASEERCFRFLVVIDCCLCQRKYNFITGNWYICVVRVQILPLPVAVAAVLREGSRPIDTGC